ncbi:MAG: zinc ribbon domain-containing protein [Dehalococcoidia bacterium]|nr:MAG: zinc ribbon domain-containing protein [Dehalococcoidia bacterium]
MEEELVILAGVVAGIWALLLWLSVVVWVYRDTRDRTRDSSLQTLSVFVVLMFFPGFNLPGLSLYLLMRPRETLEEAYARSLEEEALLRELGDEGSCLSCRRLVDKDFQYCPSCQTQLKDQCAKCERLLSFSWVACPTCGTARPGAVPAAQPVAAQAPSGQPTPTDQEPLEASPAAQEVEAARFQH